MTAIRSSRQPSATVDGEKKRVLVVDDDESVGSAITRVLAHLGCESARALNALDGIRTFERSKFDLVLIDIFMPGMDGFQAIKTLRQREPALPIIAMSGLRFHTSLTSTPDFLVIATELGATSYLRKPFAPMQLIAAINAELGDNNAKLEIGQEQ